MTIVRACFALILLCFSAQAMGRESVLSDNKILERIGAESLHRERMGHGPRAPKGDPAFDFILFSNLNEKAEKLWQQIVHEQGSEVAAQKTLFQPQSFDPRVKELHQEFAAFARSTVFYPANFNDPTFFEAPPEAITVPISGLAHVILLNLAVDGMTRLYSNVKGGLLFRKDRKKFEIDHLVACATNAREFNSNCGDSYTAEDLSTARQLGVAYMIAYQQLDRMCENSINTAWTATMATFLSQNLSWEILHNSSRKQFQFKTSTEQCVRSRNRIAQENQIIEPIRRFPKIVKGYLQ